MPAISRQFPATATPRPQRRQDERRRQIKTSDQSLHIRTLQLQYKTMMRLLPVTLAITVVSTLTVAASSHGLIDDLKLFGWMIAVVAVTALYGNAWWQWRHGKQAGRIRVRPRLTAAQAGASAALWIAGPALMLPAAPPTQQALITTALLGMVCSAGITLAALPIAAWAYLGAMGAGAVYAFVAGGGTVPLYALAQWFLAGGMAAAGVVTLKRFIHSRVQVEAKAEHQNQLIGLLLRDFEEQGSDILWEIDAKGRLMHVSTRLASALQSDQTTLNGREFLALVNSLQRGLADAERDSMGALKEKLTGGQPFRDVMLPLVINGQSRWWSMTAKPLVNERGSPIGWRGVARDVTQARVADRRLAWLAHFDTLTGLTNRAHFRVLLENALQPPRNREHAQGAVLCLDLDNFKSVNDTLGHATGDALLIEVANRLKKSVSKSDVVARLGGDEFAILLHHLNDDESISQACDRILDSMRDPCIAQGATVQVRTSIGVARFPQDGTTVDEMMQNADLALYDAKARSPGGMRFFASSMGETVRRRLVLERDLREAMDQGQLSLHYQPKVNIRTWEIMGFEALLRWHHPEHGDIPPNEFIPVAEETGLILQMGAWALTEACREATTWPLGLHVAVNISPVQVMTQNLAQTVQQALRDSQLPPERLELEITESVFINETRGTVERLHALRKLGVQIALDDFGTGYSSLAYLRRFPFDTLKIDRAFVRELLVSRDARSIVRNILALAKSLRMQTVAEGVEEPAQINVLEAEGCDLVQGYFVSRPLPANQVLPFVALWQERDRPQAPRDFELGVTQVADFMVTMPAPTAPAPLL